MAERRPLVRIAGRIVELPSSDSLPGGGGGGGGAGYYVGETAPADPVANPLWFNLTTGAFLSYVDDGISAQWVEVGGGGTRGVFVQDTQPVDTGVPYLWVQTGLPGSGFTLWFNDTGTT
jgi:hypothetical protein